MLSIGALVAYKGKPARISAITTHKFEITFTDGSTRKVREKDFLFVHPEYEAINDNCSFGDIDTLKDFEDESLTIKEITEWVFDDYNTQNAWCAYLIVKEGIYCSWNKDKIFIRPKEQRDTIQNQREAKRIERESLNKCIKSINNNSITDDDFRWLKEVELVAHNLSKHAKLLDALAVKNNPESAHKLLLEIGYWSHSINPYPRRNGVLADQDYAHKLIITDREDLTYLNCYAIDNTGSTDADDAISIDGDMVWIHIADVASQVDSELDIYAQKRISNLYLPDQIIHMLPPNIVPFCSLGDSDCSRAISIGFTIKGDLIDDIKVLQSNIKVEKLSYEKADVILGKHKELSQFNIIAKEHKAYRNANGALRLDLPKVDAILFDDKVNLKKQELSESREMIAEIMVIAGRVAAQFALKNDIPMPYVTQECGSFSDDILEQKLNLTLSQMFQASRCFKHSKISFKSAAHAGLGLSSYIRVTSPIRRYLDLVAQQQLVNFINKKPILDESEIKVRIDKNNTIISNVNKATRQSIDHFKCLFLQQNKGWKGVGTIVEFRGKKTTLLIAELGLTTQLKLNSELSLDDEVLLRVIDVDFENRLAYFKPL